MSNPYTSNPGAVNTEASVTLPPGVSTIWSINHSYSVSDLADRGEVSVTHAGEEKDFFDVLKGDQGSRQYLHGWRVGNDEIVITLSAVSGAKGSLTVMATQA